MCRRLNVMEAQGHIGGLNSSCSRRRLGQYSLIVKLNGAGEPEGIAADFIVVRNNVATAAFGKSEMFFIAERRLNALLLPHLVN